MAYCILRAKKLKSFGAVAGSVQHTLREIQTLNADESRRHMNQHIGPSSSGGVLAVLRDLLPPKRRKDAVIAIEYLVTASQDFFAGHTRVAYFKGALDFLKQRHGKQNVLSAALHLDETTPHLVVYVVPINSAGKLTAKDFLGGREKLSQLQTDFFEAVGGKFGLERGIKGSRATHQKVKQFYSQISSEADLQPLGKIDKFADALGLKTDATMAREKAEKALQSRAIETGKNSLQAARDGQKHAEKSLEKLRQESAVANEIAEFSRLNFERERKKNAELSDELSATKKQLQDTQDHSAALYERTQAFEFLARSSKSSNPVTHQETTHDNVLQTSKPRLAR